jgi:hypothetical protein
MKDKIAEQKENPFEHHPRQQSAAFQHSYEDS